MKHLSNSTNWMNLPNFKIQIGKTQLSQQNVLDEPGHFVVAENPSEKPGVRPIQMAVPDTIKGATSLIN